MRLEHAVSQNRKNHCVLRCACIFTQLLPANQTDRAVSWFRINHGRRRRRRCCCTHKHLVIICKLCTYADSAGAFGAFCRKLRSKTHIFVCASVSEMSALRLLERAIDGVSGIRLLGRLLCCSCSARVFVTPTGMTSCAVLS